MDNVKFHKRNIIREFFQTRNINYDYLPPYSPQLNPIEEVFSALKSRYYVKRPLPKSETEIINYVNGVIREMNEDRNFCIENFYGHTSMFLDKAFNSEFF